MYMFLVLFVLECAYRPLVNRRTFAFITMAEDLAPSPVPVRIGIPVPRRLTYVRLSLDG